MTRAESTRIAKNTVYLYVRMAISMVISLYTSRIVLRAMGFEDFGVYGVIGGIVAMFTFLNSSLSQASSRYLTIAIGEGDRRWIDTNFNASLGIHFGLAFLVLLLCETGGLWYVYNVLVYPEGKFAEVVIAYHLSILTAIIPILTVPFNSMIIAYEKMGIFALFAITDTLFKLGVAYIISAAPGHRLSLYALLMCAICLFNASFYVIYVFAKFKVRLRIVRDLSLYRKMLSFAGWTMFGSVAYIGYTQGVNMLLNFFFGPVVNAARAISVQIEATLRSFTTNFQTAINPRIIKTYAQHEIDYMHRLIFASSKLSFFLLLVIGLPIAVETPAILSWWLGDYPAETVLFFRIMILIVAMEAMSNSLMTSVSATGVIRNYQVIVSAILIAIVPLSYLFLRLGADAYIVYIVYAVVEIAACVARLVIVSPLIRLSKRHFVREVVTPCALTLAASVVLPVAMYVILADTVVNAIAIIAVCLLCSLGAAYSLGLTPSERTFVTSKIRTLCARPS